MIAEGVECFTLGFAVDMVWVKLVHATHDGRALHASLWSVVLALLGFLVIAVMAETSWALAVPASMGHGVGTFLGVRTSRVAGQTGTVGPTG